MKLLKSSFEILEQPKGFEGITKMIEIAGRTCYKSEDKITEDSAKKFVNMLIDRNHTAMLEHGTVYLKIPYNSHPELYKKYRENPYSKVEVFHMPNGIPCFSKSISEHKVPYFAVTTNYRVLVENGWLEDLKYLCEPTKYHPKRVTVRFICDRGVSHELVRHRVFSFAQESTRYCNYSRDKFGNELTFIVPSWLDGLELQRYGTYHTRIRGNHPEEVFVASLNIAERAYKNLISNGWAPQQARQVLPNALKTEIVVTGFISDWNHFFSLRTSTAKTGRPHPDIRALAEPLMGEFYKRGFIQ